MTYVEMLGGGLLLKAIVHWRQLHSLLDITCLTFWLNHSPLCHGACSNQICFKSTHKAQQGAYWSHKMCVKSKIFLLHVFQCGFPTNDTTTTSFLGLKLDLNVRHIGYRYSLTLIPTLYTDM